MALRGTLKDFGIADILQLIGHQGKTGSLTVKNRDQEVVIYFRDGTVVRAESSTRRQRELIGRMLVRAEVVSEDQLNRALDSQKRTQKRLGQILVETGTIDRKVLRTFTKLQTSETIYRLFLWDNGTYEFNQADVGLDPEFEPIRGESILMEGFRQVDEWPGIRRRITGYNLTFERIQDLDALTPAPGAADDMNLDDAFGDLEGGGTKSSGGLKNIGPNERVAYQLITPGRDVQKLIDLSRLGEFETCKALVNLLDAEVVRVAEEKAEPSAEATVGGISARPRSRFWPTAARAAIVIGVILGGSLLVRTFGGSAPEWLGGKQKPWGYAPTSLQAELSVAQEQRIGRALAVYRAGRGIYPVRLEDLVAAGLLSQRDLHFPWQERYAYDRAGDGYELARPFY